MTAAGGGGAASASMASTSTAVAAAPAGGLVAEDGVILSISTLGCSAAPFFRAAQVEHCLTGLPFFDVLTLGGAGGGGAAVTGRGARGLVPGTIVELYGPSGSGKTEIALNALAAWALPSSLGGVGGTALVLDLDFRFSAARLHELVRARASVAMAPQAAGQQRQNGRPSSSSLSSSCDADAAVEQALRRVCVAHCVDELEAFAVVEVLKYDLNHPASSSAANGAAGPALVVIDSLGPLLYERKAAEACQQPESCFDYMLARALGRLAAARAVSVLACKPALLPGKRVAFSSPSSLLLLQQQQQQQQQQHDPNSNSFPSVEHREYLPSQWARLVTHRLSLLRDAPADSPYFTARLSALVPNGLVGAGPGDRFGAYWFRVGEGGVQVLPPEPAEGDDGGGGGEQGDDGYGLA